MPAEQVRKLFELNVLGLIDLTQRALRGMLARKRGHIVNVASVAGYVSAPPISVYSASKFAVLGFSDGLRRELNGRGVAVTCVNPGPVATKFTARSELADATVLSTEVPPIKMGGVPASLVARAVARAVRMGGLPGYQTVTVPRALGLVRLGAVPVVQLAVDGVTLLSRKSPARPLEEASAGLDEAAAD
jgi:NAD(P)-dependent dehydrogenase (short-subunit alcohol dehydrogenase family)